METNPKLFSAEIRVDANQVLIGALKNLNIGIQAILLGHKKRVSQSETLSLLVVMSGLEPPTHGFSVRCSTN